MSSVFADPHSTTADDVRALVAPDQPMHPAPDRLVFVVNNAAFFESHRLPVAQRALAEGFSVGLCTGAEASATLARSAAPRLARSGVQHWRMAFRSAGINPLVEAWGLLQLVLRLRRERPTVVHCASPKGVLYGGIAARLAGVPSVVLAISGMGYAFTSNCGDGPQPLWRRALRRLARGLARRVIGGASAFAFGHQNKRVIVQNEDDRQAVCTQGLARADEVRLICGSGVDLARFVHLPLAGRGPLVVLPARLLKDKGVLEFADAARLLRPLLPDWRFVLVGTADYDNPSAVPRQRIEQWRREGLLEWWGHVEDMPGVYRQASIVCLPSYREGMPRVLLEAAAAGCAVVTSDAIGCRDAISPGQTGDLVPVGDAAALAKVLLALMRDPERCRRYGAEGRARAIALYDLMAVVDAHMGIYGELKARR